MTARFLTLSIAVLGLIGSACTQDPADKTYPVTGAVTLDGQPLADGQVVFCTRETGDFQIVPVKDGKYQGEAKAGKRRVEISAYREGKPIEMGKEKVGTTRENYLPAKYNAESTLTADVQPGPSNRFEFKLESK